MSDCEIDKLADDGKALGDAIKAQDEFLRYVGGLGLKNVRMISKVLLHT